MSTPSLALPGQLLGPTSKYTPGPGTHIYASQIYASISGPITTSPSASTRTLPTLSITRHPSSLTSGTTSILPEVDSVVLGKVVRIGARFATVEILVVGDMVCKSYGSGGGGGGFQGMIRREDVRATEKDRVVVGEGFRVGDVVRGVVISLGDQSNYYISTASNEYGVVMATSEAGNQMYPISWKEFRDPKTGLTETRKVAKPF